MLRLRWIIVVATAALVCAPLTAPLSGQGGVKVDVEFTDWNASTPNAHPHDPAFGLDGTLWYSGQRAQTLGRVDMATGQVREFPLPGRHGPHGLVSDRAGNIWYTGNAAGLIGKLDPKTGQVTEFKMPDPAARDPHTLIFDRNDILWFTVQGGSFVGRLDPKTGEVTLKQPPTPRAAPYGIVVLSNGTPVFDLFRTNKIGTIDPKTMEITEYALPQGARPRRIAVDANDIVWYTDFARGFLGRLDLKTKQVQEFPSPAGPSSQPYGISVTPDGTVWYSESGVEPNTLVRFDPATKTFQKWNIPNGGGVVRHMVTAPNGDLLLAYSGVNKVGRVRVRKTT